MPIPSALKSSRFPSSPIANTAINGPREQPSIAVVDVPAGQMIGGDQHVFSSGPGFIRPINAASWAMLSMAQKLGALQAADLPAGLSPADALAAMDQQGAAATTAPAKQAAAPVGCRQWVGMSFNDRFALVQKNFPTLNNQQVIAHMAAVGQRCTASARPAGQAVNTATGQTMDTGTAITGIVGNALSQTANIISADITANSNLAVAQTNAQAASDIAALNMQAQMAQQQGQLALAAQLRQSAQQNANLLAAQQMQQQPTNTALYVLGGVLAIAAVGGVIYAVQSKK